MSQDDFIDISGELYRDYVYPNGQRYRVHSPQLIMYRMSQEGGYSHRIVSDHEGERKSIYIKPGWLVIEWVKRDPSTPDFVF